MSNEDLKAPTNQNAALGIAAIAFLLPVLSSCELCKGELWKSGCSKKLQAESPTLLKAGERPKQKLVQH